MQAPASSHAFLELFELLGVLARRRYQAGERGFAKLGLQHAEARLLTLLQEAGGISTQDALAEQSFIDRTNVGRALLRLELAGCARRRKDSADRRANRVQLSAKGRRTVRALARLRNRMASGFFGDLRPSEARTVLRLLKKAFPDATAPGGLSRAST